MTKLKVLEAAARKAHGQFSPSSVCRIGSRLVAEVYEWPLSHDFDELDDADGKKEIRSRLYSKDRTGVRTSRRMNLYAWLQLTEAERISMDKWDLFPHQRDDNTEWMEKYSHLRHLISKLSGPAGSINSIKPTPVEGAQAFIDRSTDATHQANSPTSTVPVPNHHTGAPNGNVPDPAPAGLAHSNEVVGQDQAEAHGSNTAVHFAGGTAVSAPPRTGTNLTTASAAQGSVFSQPSSSRRTSIIGQGSANWMTDTILQERADRTEHESAVESADDSTQT